MQALRPLVAAVAVLAGFPAFPALAEEWVEPPPKQQVPRRPVNLFDRATQH